VTDLGDPVRFVKGIGPQRAAALTRAGVASIEDLLLHLPLRYEDRRSFASIGSLRAGMTVAVRGNVVVAGLRRGRGMSLYEIRLEDETGRLKALWFNQPFLKDVLSRGKSVVLFGAVEPDTTGSRLLSMKSPQYEIEQADEDAGIHTGRIVPVYEKLAALPGKALRRILTALARGLGDEIRDPLPSEVRERLGVIGRAAALRGVHDPAADADLALLNSARSPSHVRLILEELFLFQLGLAWRRRRLRSERKGLRFEITDRTREAVKQVLPFRLTEAQKRVLREIATDLQAAYPMNRLVQGDVGSGKTVVALLSMLVAAESGHQAAFMAPTEILAEQHYLTFRRLLARRPYGVELVSRAVKGVPRRKALERLASGESAIGVGTHALLQEGVRFRSLGLAVVDEQHRFGVLQREDLRRKGYDVDVLVMTATPIPRTLALTAHGDLDTSIMDERPPGRTPVRTLHRPASARREVLELVRSEVLCGRQAFVVYPLVEESEKLEDVKAATQMAVEWANALPGVRVGLLHGRLGSAEKEASMGAFARGETQVLVATTVIEVGVDVPNASVMVIEHAERFGLAQLHQLRGRVGRGAAASSCVLLSHGRLSVEARARLDALVQSDDGFAIAEMDLAIRGPGDFFGTRQSGLPSFRVSHLIRDRDLLERAREAAFGLVAESSAPFTGELAEFLEGGGWERRFGLARVG
jgi:ATP-dependent DNA helicase RecG